MKRLLPVSCVCALSLFIGGCQSISGSDIQARLNSLDFNLDSSSYIARAGESLETIARRYDTPVAQLQRLNPHALNGVYPGMNINIREPFGASVQNVENARWLETDQVPNRSIVQAAPAPVRQAVPLPTAPVQRIPRQATPIPAASAPIIASDQYLIGRAPVNNVVRQQPAIVAVQPAGYVEQPGYPVEEVIQGDDWVLPNSIEGVEAELDKFVGGWQWPLDGQLARDYDPHRPNGRGIEIVGLPGQQVFATRNGVVDWVARSPDGVGKVVIVRHDDDYLSIYSNAQELNVRIKDVVSQGEPIAILGANANDEPLLRFEISKNGNLLNPMDFLSPR